jgi:hypothetical protein
MFSIIEKFEKKHLFDWIKWSVDLTRNIKGEMSRPMPVERRRYHDELKLALNNTGVKFNREHDLFKQDCKVIADLIDSNPEEATDAFKHAYQTLAIKLNEATKEKEQKDLQMEEIDAKIEALKVLKMEKRVEVLAASTKKDDLARKSYILETYVETINAALEAK